MLKYLITATRGKLVLAEVLHRQGRNADSVAKHQANKLKTGSVEFIDDVVEAYRCDLVICRSGALTVSEVAAAVVPQFCAFYA